MFGHRARVEQRPAGPPAAARDGASSAETRPGGGAEALRGAGRGSGRCVRSPRAPWAGPVPASEGRRWPSRRACRGDHRVAHLAAPAPRGRSIGSPRWRWARPTSMRTRPGGRLGGAGGHAPGIEPSMATGTMGTPACEGEDEGALLEGQDAAVRERVPSGKARMQMPPADALAGGVQGADRLGAVARSTKIIPVQRMYQPRKGTLRSVCLAMKRRFTGSTANAAGMSSATGGSSRRWPAAPERARSSPRPGARPPRTRASRSPVPPGEAERQRGVAAESRRG